MASDEEPRGPPAGAPVLPDPEDRAGRAARVFPAGRDEELRAMFLVDEAASGWTFERAVVERDAARAAFRHRTGLRTLVTLLPRGSEARGPSVATREFVVVPAGQSPLERLLAAQLGARVRRLETGWRWPVVLVEPATEAVDPGDAAPTLRGFVDVELQALAAGLRPGLRATYLEAELPGALRMFAEAGLFAFAGDPVSPAAGAPGDRIVYAARTEAEARAIERSERVVDHYALGALLGYPDCCVDAFVDRVELVAGGDDEAWVRSRAAWTERPAPRLNTLRRAAGAFFLSFEPCRLDCAAAIRIADHTAAILRPRFAEQVARIDAALARHVVVGPAGQRAEVQLDDAGRIEAATLLRRRRAQPVTEPERRWAEALLGATAGERGALFDRSVLLPFGRRDPS